MLNEIKGLKGEPLPMKNDQIMSVMPAKSRIKIEKLEEDELSKRENYKNEQKRSKFN